MALYRQFAIECDRCHIVVGWSATSKAARTERRKAGWKRLRSPWAPRGRDLADLCSTCVKAVEQG